MWEFEKCEKRDYDWMLWQKKYFTLQWPKFFYQFSGFTWGGTFFFSHPFLANMPVKVFLDSLHILKFSSNWIPIVPYLSWSYLCTSRQHSCILLTTYASDSCAFPFYALDQGSLTWPHWSPAHSNQEFLSSKTALNTSKTFFITEDSFP